MNVFSTCPLHLFLAVIVTIDLTVVDCSAVDLTAVDCSDIDLTVMKMVRRPRDLSILSIFKM